MSGEKNHRAEQPHSDIGPEVPDACSFLPDAGQRHRMLDHLMTRVARDRQQAFVTVRNEDGKWSEIAAGVYRKPLISNGTVSAALYRMLPGSFYPAHDHAADEECLCLEGEVDLGGMVIRAGEFQFAPQGSAHGIIRSASGCVLYSRTLCKATAEHS